MSSGIHRAVSFGSWEALSAALEVRLPSGTFFLATREELALGLEVSLAVTADSTALELVGNVLRADFDERGDTGYELVLSPASLAAADAARELAVWHGEVDLPARLLARLAGVRQLRKELPRALELSEASLARWRAARWPNAEARVQANLGALFAQQKQPLEAGRHFEQAAEAAAASGDLLFQARALVSRARALSKAEPTAARAAAAEARKLAVAVGWAEGAAQADALLA